MDGLGDAPKKAAADALQAILNGTGLDCYVEIRRAGTGETVYGFVAGQALRNGDTLRITHTIGDVHVES